MLVQLRALAGPNEGHTVSFDRHDTFVVGRSARSTVRLPHRDGCLSRFHFMIEVNPPLCRVVDLGSRNGTTVNGRKVDRADLRNGDVLQAGKTAFRVRVEQDPGTPTRTAIPSAVSSADDSAVYPAVPGFRPVRQLGRGGMGMVYKAVREADGLPVALKVVRPAMIPSPTQVERFRREAAILRQLDHPNVVRYLDGGAGDGLVWFAMEYVPGENAADRVKGIGPLPVPPAVRVAVHVLKALAAAHAKGFVHRDVKPSNVLLARRPSGRYKVKLADFGLARVYAMTEWSGLTLVGDIGGTPRFMPPEQFLDFRNVGPAADVYGTAATLYYLLTGDHLFDPLYDPVQSVLESVPAAVTARRPDVPPALAEAVQVGLAKDPSKRWASAAAFAKALVPFTRAG